MKRHLLLWIILTIILLPVNSNAEWFIDPYAGASFTRDVDVDVNASGGGFSLDGEFKSIDLDDSIIAGLRIGRWFDGLPFLGLAVDAFYFRPEVKSQTVPFVGTGSVTIDDDIVVAPGSGQAQIGDLDFHIVGISADFMLRLPLGEGPDGIAPIQPYAFVGPTLFITAGDEEADTTLGIKAGGGITLMITKNLGLFAEYRFTHFSPEVEVESGGVRADIEADITTHSAIGGVSFRF